MDPRIMLIFLAGFLGGLAAFLLGLPMPFMLGGIFGTTAFVLYYEKTERQLPKLSSWIRQFFMSVIGAIIGSRFSPELMYVFIEFWISCLTLIPFILLAHAGSYAIMRKLGSYNRIDAYFATLPGGIIDSVALAEQMGADLKIVTTQHFIRIVMVVACVPMLFFLLEGHAVGSAAGMAISTTNYNFVDIVIILLVAIIGLGVGKLIKLPASHMMGSLFVGMILSISGSVQIFVPFWLPHLAQFAIGTALGAQFSGVSMKMLNKGLSVGVIVGTYMLFIGALIAFILHHFVPADFGPLFVSFAAGGLAEMSLIALSLNFNPVIVALHHLFRIILTVLIGSILANHIFKLGMKN